MYVLHTPTIPLDSNTQVTQVLFGVFGTVLYGRMKETTILW
jgi:hypothetical protein